jgi:hypothetical protein
VDSLGKTLIGAGLLLIAAGLLVWWLGRSGGGLLPGDIVIEKRNFRFTFPIVTCLLLSAVLSLLMSWWRR